MSLAQTAAAIGAEMSGPDVIWHDVCTDSRTLKRGDLFVALRGGRFDGHDFVAQAAAAGAVAALVARDYQGPAPLPLARVADTTLGLADLAAHWRRRFTLPLIAVTGSNGKTTVKEMIAACLRAHYGDEAVLATRGNLNNHIGLPLTLLRLRDSHRAAVVELGMNHRGETAQLARIAMPTIGVINNAQREHQEFMRSVDEVAAEHADLLAALMPQGCAVINADDAHAGLWRAAAGRARVIDFGLGEAAVRGECRLQPAASRLSVSAGSETAAFDLPLAGEHNARNALAAIAAATAAGVPLATCALALAAFSAVKGRLQERRGLRGSRLIDDSYNANPDSVRAAIDVLAQAPGRRLLALGDMGEVGEQGEAFHCEIGEYARSHGVHALFTTGELARHAAAAYGAGASHHESAEALAAAAAKLLDADTTVLVKGSRFMRMERVVEALEAAAAAAAGKKGG
ncbi:MAG: UDP-N-acetylmuramoyl-tripeptide--D-alanyl-D-alanine ligase [Betaproteobacteria bacterium]|nr:UDP-N-acetylmuramoyl-tripeptide--D-alanyl-D-alanine ligase [Betaproteobacteria bacterium]